MEDSNNLTNNSEEVCLSQERHKYFLKELEENLRNKMEKMILSHTKMLEDQQHTFQPQLEYSHQEFQE